MLVATHTPSQNASVLIYYVVNATMAPSKDMPGESTCTTCQFSEDFRYPQPSFMATADIDIA
jgi:hypothetical protein